MLLLGVVLLKVCPCTQLQWRRAHQVNTIYIYPLLHAMKIRSKDHSCNNRTEKESYFSECQRYNW